MGAHQTRTTEFRSLYQNSLGQIVFLPHLQKLGYEYLGARIAAASSGPMSILIYENDPGSRISILTWCENKPDGKFILPPGFDNVQIRYCWQSGLGFAVIGDPADTNFNSVAQTIFSQLEKRK